MDAKPRLATNAGSFRPLQNTLVRALKRLVEKAPEKLKSSSIINLCFGFLKVVFELVETK